MVRVDFGLKLLGVIGIAAALSGCGIAQDVAQQAGIPDSFFQALGLSSNNAPATAQAAKPSMAAAVPARSASRHKHKSKRHAHRRKDDKTAVKDATPAEVPVASDKSIEAQNGGPDANLAAPPAIPAPDASSGPRTIEAQAPAEAKPAQDGKVAAAPEAGEAPRHFSRKQIEEKVYAAIQKCKERHQQGGLSTYKETAECMGPRIWAAWREANYPYMDLIGLYVSALETGAAKLDRKEITEAEFEQQMTRMQSRIAGEEQRRNLPAAQLMPVNSTGGMTQTSRD